MSQVEIYSLLPACCCLLVSILGFVMGGVVGFGFPKLRKLVAFEDIMDVDGLDRCMIEGNVILTSSWSPIAVSLIVGKEERHSVHLAP